jgi:DNA invertase Pin-like site-specific DNA recombinase
MLDLKPGTTAYSYIRMSTKAQLQGDSLRRQTERSVEFATKHQLDLDSSLRNIGVSAWNGDNKREGALSRFDLNLI